MSSTFPVLNPATEEVITHVPDAGPAEWSHAFDEVVAAGDIWARRTPRERSTLLLALSRALEELVDEFAALINEEMGKPFPEARGEVLSAVDTLKWYSEEAVRLAGRYVEAPAGGARFVVTRRPVGPVLAITPWNFPLSLGIRKLAPALAAGCPVLLKPAADAPLSLLRWAEVMSAVAEAEELGPCPVKVVTTTRDAELSRDLMGDPRLRKVAFTGSTAAGRVLVEQSGRNLLRTSMELGGNAPFIVHEDADLEAAVRGAFLLKTRNSGQVCVAANRILVHEAVAEEFTARLVELMANAPAGPLINERQRERVAGLVAEAVAAGATLHCGGRVPEGRGFFYPPTVLSDVPAEARLSCEEIFGPVAVIQTFASLEEAVALANSTEFGLAAYAYTQGLSSAQYLADTVAAGMLAINADAVFDNAAPFGGIKHSGFGREGGSEGIDEYLDVRLVRWPR